MRRDDDLKKVKQCINFIKLKVIDYDYPKKDIPEEFFNKLIMRVTLYGNQLEELDKYLRDVMFKSLKDNNCSIKDETALVALEIIRKAIKEFIDSTDTYPKLIMRMNAKDIFEIVSEFTEDKNDIKIAAYALGQYKITASSSTEVKEPPEFEDPDDDLDWIDLEEEEDDENQFIDDN